MKTWEMIKELTENPSKKFKSKGSFGIVTEVYIGEYGYLQAKVSCKNQTIVDNVKLDYEWQEVKQPVSFMTAMKAYREGKAIRCDMEDEGAVYIATGPILNHFREDEILYGKWYIQD